MLLRGLILKRYLFVVQIIVRYQTTQKPDIYTDIQLVTGRQY